MKIFFLIFFASLLFSSQTEDLKEYELGKKIYFDACISCHGEMGIPNKELKLAIRPRNLNKTILLRSQIYKVIKNGARVYGAHSTIMPSFKYLYNDKTIKALTTFIYIEYAKNTQVKIDKHLLASNSLSKEEKKSMLKVGKKIFKKTCSKCHGKSGNADSLYVKSSTIDHNFIYPYNLKKLILNEDQIFLFTKYGSHYWGSDSSDMPAWKDKYSDIELKSVANFIQESLNQN